MYLSQRGISMMELVIAMGVFALVGVGSAGLIKSSSVSGNRLEDELDRLGAQTILNSVIKSGDACAENLVGPSANKLVFRADQVPSKMTDVANFSPRLPVTNLLTNNKNLNLATGRRFSKKYKISAMEVYFPELAGVVLPTGPVEFTVRAELAIHFGLINTNGATDKNRSSNAKNINFIKNSFYTKILVDDQNIARVTGCGPTVCTEGLDCLGPGSGGPPDFDGDGEYKGIVDIYNKLPVADIGDRIEEPDGPDTIIKTKEPTKIDIPGFSYCGLTSLGKRYPRAKKVFLAGGGYSQRAHSSNYSCRLSVLQNNWQLSVNRVRKYGGRKFSKYQEDKTVDGIEYKKHDRKTGGEVTCNAFCL